MTYEELDRNAFDIAVNAYIAGKHKAMFDRSHDSSEVNVWTIKRDILNLVAECLAIQNSNE